MNMTMLSDKELINIYLNGSEKAFQELLSRHEEKIYTSIYMFVKNTEQAEDIFQEVFIKIIKTLRAGKYNHEGKFGQWAMRIAYNMCVDNFRKSKRRPQINPTEEFDIFEVLPLEEDNVETELIKDETFSKIRHLVDLLPPEQREVVILRHYAELSFKEIAQLTRVSINTALGRMRYALINMRKIVEEKNVVLN
ncbi:RNA polymerase sigma factor [Membranihabitans marinus]|uniref:RNA polymerase sigma factor n=1 Tax=Membranihabitans marinus TaxID=1227546 RepID=UPI00293F345B|nr:sigma-70 family RNA polymerase sigma factor [Membranihabitans marinus]